MTDVQAEAGPSTLPDSHPIAAPGATATKAIPVRLTSRTDKHAIPESKFMIPSDWRRFQLSELINKVLGNEQAVPFDFVVGEELLRSSLGQFTQAKGLTEESILEIEYVESVLPPKYLSAFEHEDWVSDVDMSVQGSFLTASYDSNIRIFSNSGKGAQRTLSGAHTLPVLSACWLPSSSASTNASRYIASGGMDRVIRVWEVPTSEEGEAINTHALSLHTAPVSSVRSREIGNGKQRQLLSAGWDGLVAFWEFDPTDRSAGDGEAEEEADATRQKKRRRGANGASTTGEKVMKVRPTLVLPGHTGQVSRAIFSHDSNGTTAHSFGLDDHSVRTWDLAAGGVQSGIKQSDKAIMAGAQLASANLLLTGNADRSVCLWDTRESDRVISLTLQGHTASVAAVAAHPTSQLLFSSAGFDGNVKIWDARSPKQALFSVQRQRKQGPVTASLQNKILCMAWNGELIASGGEDGKLELLQSKGM